MENKELQIRGYEYAGTYTLGEYTNEDGSKHASMALSLKEKPNFIHRAFMKYCLGFTWRDRVLLNYV